MIRAFRLITKKAGLGEDWVPREMRHTFVSVLSANGVPVESIALLAGHDRTATTESVYRHEIRPALTQGAGWCWTCLDVPSDQVLRGPVWLGVPGRLWPLAASWATRPSRELAGHADFSTRFPAVAACRKWSSGLPGQGV